MTRFAFVTWDGGGNVPPAIGIAHELAARGHSIDFIGYEVQRKRFEAAAFGFTVLRRSGGFDIYSATDPAERLTRLIANVWACPEHLEDISDAVNSSGADVLVVDFSMLGALAAAAQLTIPVAVLAHSTVTGLVPPPESPMGTTRLTATNQLRERAGLPRLTRLNDAWFGLPTLVTTIPDLDPAAESAANDVHYVGPIFERLPDQRWESPWDLDDDRPLVVVSFTTTGLWDQSGRIRNTLDALAAECVRVIASAPNGVEAAAVPSNAVIRRFVPHHLVLAQAAVTVTHAGHGTVAASLAHGVPIVALPNPAADQPFLAATIQRLGAGLALDGGAGPDAIRTAVMEVLGEPSYADAARTLAIKIAKMPGATGAADQLERLARAPVIAPV
ncbi:MAG TPA: nucleotide disphospho-sugar-binding domain-containing protein [Candidatus Dormibacteraeota bacterium]|jgi:MGT family glycosyltransferase